MTLRVIAPWMAFVCSIGACRSEGTGKADPTPGDASPSAQVSPERACGGCHPNHVEEWRISPHAYAMRDPVFHAMVRVGQRETEGAVDQFCVQCHTPIGVENGETRVFVEEGTGNHVQATEGLSVQAMSGVSCEVCHSMVHVEKTANAGFVMQRDGVRRATLRDPVATSAHESEYSALHHESEMCGTCHQVVNDFGVPLERTHMEWVQSRFNGAQDCQDCHMPSYEGSAVIGGKPRAVHRHTFEGVDVSLLSEDEFPGYWELRELSERLLKESAALSVEANTALRTLDLVVENKAGHSLPSGATADREMWVELFVRDRDGRVVFESGTLDENGDLRVDEPAHTTRPGTDPQLVLYSQKMYFDPKLADPSSTEPARRVEFLWEPNTEVSHLVPAGAKHRPQYHLDALPPGEYRADLRLLFRSFPPHLLRKLEQEGGLPPEVKDRVPTVEMATASVSFALP